MNKRNWLVVIVCCILVMACGPTAAPEPTAAPTSTTEPTRTASPTSTPSPAPTERPPTRTPRPTATARPETPAGEGYPGLIAYTRETETGFDVCVVAPDGTGMEVLTELYGGAFRPRWSPDGRQIAFYSYDPRSELVDLWVVDVETREARPLTEEGAAETMDRLSWSPDGRFLIYTAGQPNGAERDVYRLDVSTGEVENLTADCGVWDSAPVWSPDGQMIAFVSDRLDAGCDDKMSDEIWVMGTDGAGLVNLTNNHEYFWEDEDPRWSPDSKEIAFYRWSLLEREYPGGQAGLWAVNAVEGTERLVYGYSSFFSDPPAWSPDGAYIAFNQGDTEETDVWIVPAAGGEAVQISHLPGEEVVTAWSPDSRAILFTNVRESGSSLYVASIDGAESYVLYAAEGDVYGDWSR